MGGWSKFRKKVKKAIGGLDPGKGAREAGRQQAAQTAAAAAEMEGQERLAAARAQSTEDIKKRRKKIGGMAGRQSLLVSQQPQGMTTTLGG